VAGDRQFILRNEHIGDFQTVLASFSSDYWGKLGGESFIYYRPLVILTHYVDFQLYGLNPAGHHFSNIIFHSIVTLSVYCLFLKLLSGNCWPALAGASLFALHPIHTHSVSYVMGRTDILATLFFIWGLTILVTISRHDAKRARILAIIGACLCYLLSLLCKEMAVTLPLVFVAYLLFVDRTNFFWKDRGFIISLLCLACTLGVYLVLRVSAVGMMSSEQSLPPGWYSVTQKTGLVIHTLGFYLQKLLFPLQLSYYSNMVVPGSWQETVTSPLFVTFMVWLLTFAISLKHNLPISFSLVWIAITLLPVLNIFMLPALAKENYLYLPSIGFCFLFAFIVAEGMKHNDFKRGIYTRAAYSGIMVIGLLYAGGTILRNYDYKDPITFLKSSLAQMPCVALQNRDDPRYFEAVKNFYTTHKNLGILYQECNQPEGAINAYQGALKYTPSYFSAHYAASVKVPLAMLLNNIGNTEEAFKLLNEARPIAANPAMVDNLLGIISNKQGTIKDAEFYFKRAISQDYTYAQAHYNLGILYLESGERQKGIEELRVAVRLDHKYANRLTNSEETQLED
jgi:Tfp pilus assembly protein PilF